ncbi:signal peptidase II [Sphingomonas sp. KR3-1]|uniref:signal peptidase II n=1 Tax=Sphingomonas sp. KR3-1 TaxID=3156611 RepID=UPI0032B5D89A
MDRRTRIIALLVTALAIALDQSTKYWALAALGPVGGHVTLPGPVDLTLSFNQSNAFGLTPVIGQATRWFLMTLNFAVAGGLLYVMLAKPLRPLMRFGLALIVAGAIGNGLDRLLIGPVIDFLDSSKIGFVWIFNLADATLDAGIGLMLLDTVLGERRTRATAA